MPDSPNDSKVCDSPQTLPTGSPTNEWQPEQLSFFAQIQYHQIVDEEARLTRPYWRLGHALELAKKSFGHGQWAQYLKGLGIDQTRASKARAIYRAFAQEADVAKLTVEEAYAQRPRKRPHGSVDSAGSKKRVSPLRSSVGKIAQRTGAVIHAAACAAPADAVILIPAVRKAIHELQTLLEFLERQAAEAPPDRVRGRLHPLGVLSAGRIGPVGHDPLAVRVRASRWYDQHALPRIRRAGPGAAALAKNGAGQRD